MQLDLKWIGWLDKLAKYAREPLGDVQREIILLVPDNRDRLALFVLFCLQHKGGLPEGMGNALDALMLIMLPRSPACVPVPMELPPKHKGTHLAELVAIYSKRRCLYGVMDRVKELVPSKGERITLYVLFCVHQFGGLLSDDLTHFDHDWKSDGKKVTARSPQKGIGVS